ncbi:1-aminocyclopropane-1-carboxylate deaminase [Leptospira yasudae]|uniref:1-aminocyclopropane-1-carboxylate deaminase n=1 Tax=Leptospira yasudae TaxID=2202201 RepID=UPI000E599656|nr:1-aminocyclopropane-1-carboxylate deaminase [Leptospira yasudae]RHX93990.1 1-aminocyclopropane-1-carboxylate deaminase [Leptospira yasudae]
MKTLQEILVDSVVSPIEVRALDPDLSKGLFILLDGRLAFSIGTKVRKFFGFHSALNVQKVRSVLLQGELHSNALGAFSYLFRVFGYEVHTIAYARNRSLTTANSVLVKWNSHKLEIFPSRREWKERIKALSADSIDTENFFSEEDSRNKAPIRNDSPWKDFRLIPEYGLSRAAAIGLDSLWERIQISKYERIVLDLGSGLTWLSASRYFGNSIPIYGISVGLSRSKMMEWLEEKKKFLGFHGFQIEGDKILSPEFSSGFGSRHNRILEYSNSFYRKTGIPIEPIYSGISLLTVEKRIDSGFWKGNTLYIHQGGLLNFLDPFIETF